MNVYVVERENEAWCIQAAHHSTAINRALKGAPDLNIGQVYKVYVKLVSKNSTVEEFRNDNPHLFPDPEEK